MVLQTYQSRLDYISPGKAIFSTRAVEVNVWAELLRKACIVTEAGSEIGKAIALVVYRRK